MIQKTFTEKLKELDVYRKLPKEYLQPSFLGAICKLLIIKSFCNLIYNNNDTFLLRNFRIYDN